ncbi:MAG TPA: hypothetical protein VKI00_17655 [Mycobacterium sp.]|uniref:hypothetical protein n=1 Tax=Mycobacterium sp. TaxID=1785 RepID=UPI002BAC0316|nr:hypothetical protein [Mycobacterium sp.]HME77399.1 hypothetical protein [Mycobacterium sp.]
MIFLKGFRVTRDVILPGTPVGSPVDGQREDFYSVRGRQEINNNNSNKIARRGSATGQSAAVRGVA